MELAWSRDDNKNDENRTGFRGLGAEGLDMIGKGGRMRRIRDKK